MPSFRAYFGDKVSRFRYHHTGFSVTDTPLFTHPLHADYHHTVYAHYAGYFWWPDYRTRLVTRNISLRSRLLFMISFTLRRGCFGAGHNRSTDCPKGAFAGHSFSCRLRWRRYLPSSFSLICCRNCRFGKQQRRSAVQRCTDDDLR